MTEDSRAFWDEQARTFDAQPDHGLTDPHVRAAWVNLLVPRLPPRGAAVVDLGCGTGSLSVLLAQEGYAVRGVDFSAEMVRLARDKAAAAGVSANFEQGDAANPALSPASADVVLVRHVLWALPDMDAAVRRWVEILKPQGVLVLVEGRWWTGGGLSSAQCERVVGRHRSHVAVVPLDDPALWGRVVDDERYLLLSNS